MGKIRWFVKEGPEFSYNSTNRKNEFKVKETNSFDTLDEVCCHLAFEYQKDTKWFNYKEKDDITTDEYVFCKFNKDFGKYVLVNITEELTNKLKEFITTRVEAFTKCPIRNDLFKKLTTFYIEYKDNCDVELSFTNNDGWGNKKYRVDLGIEYVEDD